MKLRILRKSIYVSSGAQKGWKAAGINRKKDIIQMWDDKEGWINLPIVHDTSNIYDDALEVEVY